MFNFREMRARHSKNLQKRKDDLNKRFIEARQQGGPFGRMAEFAKGRSSHVWNYVLRELAKVPPTGYDQNGNEMFQLSAGEYKAKFPTYSERYIADAALAIAAVASPNGPESQNISDNLFSGPTTWNMRTQRHEARELSSAEINLRITDIYAMAGVWVEGKTAVARHKVANADGADEGTATYLTPTAFGVNIREIRGPKGIELSVEKPIVSRPQRRTVAASAA